MGKKLNKKRSMTTQTTRYITVVTIFSILMAAFFFSSSSQKPLPQKKEFQQQLPETQDKSRHDHEPVFEDFVGSDQCKECHQEEYQLWKDSTHAQAGGPPGSGVIVSTFSGTNLVFKDAVVKLSTSRENNYIFTVAQDRLPQKVFKVQAVIGGGHMEGGGAQSYFSSFPDGTVRLLPFEFMKEKVWFCQTQKGWVPITKELSLNNCKNWPPVRSIGSLESSSLKDCQQCHGSQIQVTFNKDKRRYTTKYKSLSINCESCHDPGKRHIEIVTQGNGMAPADIGMPALSTLTKDQSLAICFQCHALKRNLGNNEYLPGKDLEHHFILHNPNFTGEGDFYPDGRVRRFAYQKNHLFSDCYLNGSLTCVDCHNPHSQKYRNIYGEELPGKFSNEQCIDCHASKGISPESHSHHQASSTGNRCVSCHMAFFPHDIGNELRLERADHSISIPRPALDSKSGRPNACKKCHRDKEISFLQQKIDFWFKNPKPQKDIIISLFDLDNIRDKGIGAKRLLKGGEYHPIFQLAGLENYILKFLDPAMKNPGADIRDRLVTISNSNNLDVKALAFSALLLAFDDNPAVQSIINNRFKKNAPDNRPFMKRWRINLNKSGIIYGRQGEYAKAFAVFKKSLAIFPGDPMLHSNLALTLLNMGKFAEAVKEFRKALRLKPDDSESLRNLGDIYTRQGRNEEAIKSYKKAIEINPALVAAYNNLGLLFYNQNKLAEAIKYHSKAIKIAPRNDHLHLSLGLDLTETGDMAGGLSHFFEAIRLNPSNAEAHNNLGLTFAFQKKSEKAIHHFSESLKINPGYVQAHYNLGDAYRYLGKNGEARDHFTKAYNIYLKNFGANHPLTLDALAKADDLPVDAFWEKNKEE